ncbi:hypothetical protein [Marinilactibacillus kalidii]|uniref:hypothetical protein n=1 Tax=Marinilactibacillus kalidii TaxID=2820274 RepID=UPI001ABE7F70|nr:hypothetical protein [Marinilactibacillus kalidii]
MTIQLVLYDKNGRIKQASNTYEDFCHSMMAEDDERVYLSNQMMTFEIGDYFEITLSKEKQYVIVQLDKTLAPNMIFIKDKKFRYDVPLEKNWIESSADIAFKGYNHYISARYAMKHEIENYQNLSRNTHDLKDETGAFPHASANVETRNDATFFARNAIDGIYANNSHGSYPYQSWGINQQDDAMLTIDYGRTVRINRIDLTLRADFPHDNYWVSATVVFSDGSEEKLGLEQTAHTQSFSINERKTSVIILKNLIKSSDSASSFPALSQIDTYGRNIQ